MDSVFDFDWHKEDIQKGFSLVVIPKKDEQNLSERKDINVPGSRVFVLEDFLSKDEAELFTQAAEKIGFESLSKEFKEDYRNNKRCSISSEEIAADLWERLLPKLNKDDIEDVRPIGFGNEGTWMPIGLDPWFKFSKYHPNTFFKPHMDSPFVVNENERTIYTVMVFLNEDFEGGITNFLDSKSKKIVASVSPKLGRAIVFNHDTLHEGSAVTKGIKYIIRTEILFKKTGGSTSDDWKQDKEFKKAVSLYELSEQLEKEGKVQESNEAYNQALAIQASRGSLFSKFSKQSEDPIWWTPDIAALILSHLSISDIIKVMAVKKSWYKIASSGKVWKPIFLRKFPQMFSLESRVGLPKEDHNSQDIFLKDWYNSYKNTYIATTQFRAIILDIGEYSVKFGMAGDNNNYLVFPSIVGQETRFHYDISAISEDDKYRIGNEVLSGNSVKDIKRVLLNGEVQSWDYMERVIKWIYSDGFPLKEQYPYLSYSLSGSMKKDERKGALSPEKFPLLIAEPVQGFHPKHKEQLEKYLFQKLGVPYLCFVNEAELSLVNSGRSTGVVVKISDSGTRVTILHNGKIVHTDHLPLGGKELTKYLLTRVNNPYRDQSLLIDYKFDDMKKNAIASQDYDEDIKKVKDSNSKSWYLFESNPGKALYTTAEILFNPSIVGIQSQNIVQFTYDTIMKVSVDEDLRNLLWNNVILSGARFEERFELEMKKLRNTFKLVHVQDRVKDVVNGGIVLASISNYREQFKINTLRKDIKKAEEKKTEEKKKSAVLQYLGKIFKL